MKQRIAVRALAKKDDKVLLLRRASGREGIIGKYELPGGRVEYGEQPEEALSRHLEDAVGIGPGTVQLVDALTYIDHDNRDIQYAVIVYVVSLTFGGGDVDLGSKYDHYLWRKPASVPQDEMTELSQLLLNIQSGEPIATAITQADENDGTGHSDIIIYSDGGSRGNPGPSAAGYVIMDAAGELIDEGGSYLGITTNNQAEYHGVHLGLEKARELGARTVEFRLDSLLVVNQMKGAYVIRNRELWPIHERILALMTGFKKVTFRHVKREFNQHADKMVNKILDAHTDETV